MALFVNGLPVATAELKNPNTGQNADHAISQYRHDRDPNEVFFAKRTLVHFAVDPDRAFIATRLRGRDTQFLPFNVGSNGPGVADGTGNPPTATGAAGASVPFAWVAADEVYGRSSKFRQACEAAGKGYVLPVPAELGRHAAVRPPGGRVRGCRDDPAEGVGDPLVRARLQRPPRLRMGWAATTSPAALGPDPPQPDRPL